MYIVMCAAMSHIHMVMSQTCHLCMIMYTKTIYLNVMCVYYARMSCIISMYHQTMTIACVIMCMAMSHVNIHIPQSVLGMSVLFIFLYMH